MDDLLDIERLRKRDGGVHEEGWGRNTSIMEIPCPNTRDTGLEGVVRFSSFAGDSDAMET